MAVGIANELARQKVLSQEKETSKRHDAVARVDLVRQAEIERDKQALAADQAKALPMADVKIISNSGSAGIGMTLVMDQFTAQGGTHLASAGAAFARTPFGTTLLVEAISGRRPVAETPDPLPPKPKAKATGQAMTVPRRQHPDPSRPDL